MPLSLIEKFQNHITESLSFLNKGKLLIAISGGLDSAVLTHLCYNLKLDVSLVHCNFNLRGKESDGDELFVLKLAEHLNLEVFIESFNTERFANANKISIQMAARDLRYDWFYELAEQLDFDYILTAHHADDNLETFLINLSRGTGLDGLTGIPETNDIIVRPILQFSREDIETYANKNNLKWREDSSNASTKYLRNKLRHDVIPILKDLNPQLLQNFKNTQNYLNEVNEIVDDSLAKIQKKVVSVKDNLVHFNIKKLQKLSNYKAYLYQLLKDFNFTQWNDIYNLLDAQTGKQLFSQTHRLVKNRKYLILSEINSEEKKESTVILETDLKQDIILGILNFETVKEIEEINDFTIYVDKDLLKFPLTVRPWQKGDYFYPFGMQGKKKLSKFFSDEKLSLLDKEKIQVLSSQDDIIWIINKRLDNRFKVSNETKSILKISVNE